MREVLDLLTETITEDIYGNQVVNETKTEVYCEVMSVSASEFFNAGESGHRPALRFDVFHGDYDGQQRCEYDGRKYYIYRTFLRGDVMELYTEERVGV